MNNNRLDWLMKRELVRGMKENIQHLGKDETWRIINNTLQNKVRLSYIEIYLQAVSEYDDNKNYLGENFPHWRE